jgi:hypothetical protein
MSEQSKKAHKAHYATIIVESAVGGWIVKEAGKPTQVYAIWEFVVRRLENSLTSKGDQP